MSFEEMLKGNKLCNNCSRNSICGHFKIASVNKTLKCGEYDKKLDTDSIEIKELKGIPIVPTKIDISGKTDSKMVIAYLSVEDLYKLKEDFTKKVPEAFTIHNKYKSNLFVISAMSVNITMYSEKIETIITIKPVKEVYWGV